MPSIFLFPLNRRRRLACYIIHHPVHAGDLVYDAGADAVEDVVGDAGPVGGHKVRGCDAPEGQGVVICPAVAHDAHGAHVRQDREILVHRLLKVGLRYLVPEDEVGLAEGVQLLLRDVANDPYCKPRPRERLAHDQILRQAQLPAQRPDLVLEEHP